MTSPHKTFPGFTARQNEKLRQHLGSYERCCRQYGLEPWPATLDTLLSFATIAARRQSSTTVRDCIRYVSIVSQERGSIDLYLEPKIALLLEGLEREKPRCTNPVPPDVVEQLFRFEPPTRQLARIRAAMVLCYAAGFTLSEYSALRAEMITFSERGATIEGLSSLRPFFTLPAAADTNVCPVTALRLLLGARISGPILKSPRQRLTSRYTGYRGLVHHLQGYVRRAGFLEVSSEGLRLAGLMADAGRYGLEELARLHGYRDGTTVANILARATASSQQHIEAWP